MYRGSTVESLWGTKWVDLQFAAFRLGCIHHRVVEGRSHCFGGNGAYG